MPANCYFKSFLVWIFLQELNWKLKSEINFNSKKWNWLLTNGDSCMLSSDWAIRILTICARFMKKLKIEKLIWIGQFRPISTDFNPCMPFFELELFWKLPDVSWIEIPMLENWSKNNGEDYFATISIFIILKNPGLFSRGSHTEKMRLGVKSWGQLFSSHVFCQFKIIAFESKVEIKIFFAF